jgi:integrase
MGVRIRKRGAKWYVYVNHHGKRKNRCVGSREAAERVRREIEARLAVGQTEFLTETPAIPLFDTYVDQWLKEYARLECKTSTVQGYEGVLRLYLRPRFGSKPLSEIKRKDIKAMINDLVAKELSRSTIHHAVCVIREICNYAIEDGILDSNPASRVGRFTRAAKSRAEKGVGLTPFEVQQCSTTTCEGSTLRPRARKAAGWTSHANSGAF